MSDSIFQQEYLADFSEHVASEWTGYDNPHTAQ